MKRVTNPTHNTDAGHDLVLPTVFEDVLDGEHEWIAVPGLLDHFSDDHEDRSKWVWEVVDLAGVRASYQD